MYTDFFHVDSRVRFMTTNGPPKNPNNYTFTLPRLLRSVREIEVFRAEVPSSMYNVTATDPSFSFAVTIFRQNAPVDPVLVTLKIPPGSYTLRNLVQKLNALKDLDVQLTQRGVASWLAFAADELTGRISLTATIPTNPAPTPAARVEMSLFPHYVLGIDQEMKSTGLAAFGEPSVVLSQHPVRLNMPTVAFLSFSNIRAIGTATDDVFSVAELFGHDSDTVSGHVPRGCTMARLQLTAETFTINYIGSENRVYLRQFPSGALNLDSLDILWTDALGRLFDFNGADHSLYLRIAYEAR